MAASASKNRRTKGKGKVAPVGSATPANKKPIDLSFGSKVTARMGRRRLIVFVTLTLYVFGLVMVASASSGENLLAGYDQWALFRKQLIFGVVGLALMWPTMNVSLEVVRRLAKPIMIICVALLGIVMLPGVGHAANGASRWINLGFFQLQPSEPLKIAVILLVADHLARSHPPEHWINDLIKSPGGFALTVAGVVVVFQNDLGSGFVIGMVTIVMYIIRGTSFKVLWRVIGPGVALVAFSILAEEYRRDRFLAFLNPWNSPEGNGYQLVQALIAIGSGGPFGVGLGHSVQKIAFLPEAHTDMIFAVIVEELGLFGVLLVLGSFVVLAWAGIRIAIEAKSGFSSMLAVGLTTMVVGQAVTNIAGVTGLMPLTGVPLPLISYGGSSLLITMVALGLLANVATEYRPAKSFSIPPPETPERIAKNSLAIDDDNEFDFDDDDEYTDEHSEQQHTEATSSRGGRWYSRAFSSRSGSS